MLAQFPSQLVEVQEPEGAESSDQLGGEERGQVGVPVWEGCGAPAHDL